MLTHGPLFLLCGLVCLRPSLWWRCVVGTAMKNGGGEVSARTCIIAPPDGRTDWAVARDIHLPTSAVPIQQMPQPQGKKGSEQIRRAFAHATSLAVWWEAWLRAAWLPVRVRVRVRIRASVSVCVSPSPSLSRY